MAANNRYKNPQAEKPAVAQGFGESKIFAAPEGSFPPAEGEIDILDCHVAGLSVRDLPRENQLRLLYQQTDEGAAWWEANKHKLENRDGHAPPSGRGMRLAGGAVATDVEDKKMVQYRDQLADDDGLQVIGDPLAYAMKTYTPAGHRGLFMSVKQCREKGMLRGLLKYEKVLVKNPTTGAMEPVEVGGMFLASVPEELARKAEKRYAAINKEKQVSTAEVVRAQSDQVLHESGLRDLAKRKHVLDDLIGSDVEDSALAEAEFSQQLQHEMTA